MAYNNPFKAGDKIECIKEPAAKTKTSPTNGQIYTVRKTANDLVYLEGYPGTTWLAYRFRHADTPSLTWTQLIADIRLDPDFWHAQAENVYLMTVHNAKPAVEISDKLADIVDGVCTYTLEDLAKAVCHILNNCQEIRKNTTWNSLTAEQKAYTLGKALDYHLPNITDGNLQLCHLLPEPTFTTIPEPTTNDIMDFYKTTPIATPTLIYGQDVDQMSDESLINATKEIQQRITKLREIPGNSRKVARQIKEAEAAMAVIVKKLDENEPEA